LNESLFHLANLYLPFGGIGYFSMGAVHGYERFKQLIHMKPVFEKGTLNGGPLSTRFPSYTPSKQITMKHLLKIGNFK
jgi:aldehyde dehydrogenase (NAD+)